MPGASAGQLLLDRYRLERELGAGGMAVVWLAHDERHDRKVAVKIIRAELSSVLGADRFLREIRLTAKLQHPHIISLIDSGALPDGRLCYVMPFVQGETLRQRLARDGTLPVAEAVRLVREMSEALAYAHRQGIVHRDMKPENVMLSEGHALVADFGIATAAADAGSRLTQTGMSLGTPLYMSPEQAAGDADIDARADVYSLAAVLYEMLAGAAPYAATSPSAVLAAKLTQLPPHVRTARPEVPVGIDEAIVRALQVQRDQRFASAGELAAALAAAETTQAGPAEGRRTGGRRWVAGTAVGLAAALAAWRLLAPGAAPAASTGASDVRFSKLTDAGTVSAVGASADGKRFAYVADSGRKIFVQNLADGAVRQLGPTAPEARDYRDVDWSTPGEDVLVKGTVRGIQGYWLASALSGEFRLLSELDDQSFNTRIVSRARSGRWLVQVNGPNTDFLVGDGPAPPMNIGGGEGGGRKITAPPGLVSVERGGISPSGELVAVSGMDTALRTRMYVVDVASGRATSVEGATSRLAPIWLDTETFVVRAERREQPATDLIRYRYSGGSVQVIDTLETGGSFVSLLMPVPGGGEAIVFKDLVAVSAYRVLPLDGRTPAREVIRSTSSVYDVEWLPDSSLVATRQEDGHVAILRGRPGSPLTPVARIPGNRPVRFGDVDAAGRRILLAGDVGVDGVEDVSWLLDVESGELRSLGRTFGMRILEDGSMAAFEFRFLDAQKARIQLVKANPPAPSVPLPVPPVVTSSPQILVNQAATHMALVDTGSIRVVGSGDSLGVTRPFPGQAVNVLELEGDSVVIAAFPNRALNRAGTPASPVTVARYSLRTGDFTPLAAVPRGCGARRLLRHLNAVILTCREVRERDLYLMKLPS